MKYFQAYERQRNARKSAPSYDDKSFTWTCQDGRVIPITEMTTSHLMNTRHFMERKYREMMQTPIVWEKMQFTKIGEYWPAYDSICKEIEKRYLNI